MVDCKVTGHSSVGLLHIPMKVDQKTKLVVENNVVIVLDQRKQLSMFLMIVGDTKLFSNEEKTLNAKPKILYEVLCNPTQSYG